MKIKREKFQRHLGEVGELFSEQFVRKHWKLTALILWLGNALIVEEV
jgi:hypothetical protein